MEGSGKPPGEGEQEEQAGGWLPPVPPGQEPQPGVFAPPPAQPGVFSPPGGASSGQGEEPPPAPGWQPQSPGPQSPQSGYGQQYGYGQQPQPGYGAPPPPGHQQQGWQGGGWQQPGWQLQPAPPGNGTAITGFVLSVSSIALLFFSAGLSSIFSLGLAIAGAIVGRNGRQKVDRGETTQHRGLGQAGFIIGIVGTVLATLATIGWILIFALVDGFDLDDDDDDFFDDDDFSGVRAVVTVAGAAARLLL